MKLFFKILAASIPAVLLFIIYTPVHTQESSNGDMCLECHSILDGKLKSPADMYRNDVHFRKGYTCASCHGGDPKSDDQDVSMSISAGFIGVPSGQQISNICAKCHEKQMKTLSESVHGHSSIGKGLVINSCVTCHGVHDIIHVKSPSSKVNGVNLVNTCAGCHSNASLIKSYNPGLSIDQLEKYKTSVHGQKIFKGDHKVASCASCHGNHDIKKVKDPQSHVYPSNIPGTCNKCHGDAEYMKEYKIPTDQYEKFKTSVHGVALLEKGDKNAPSCNRCHGDHGAAPPEVESISRVCGICHALNDQMFQESPHKEAFKKKDIHDCAACHSNHAIEHPTDEMIGDGEKSVCIKCHTGNDKGLQLAIKMKSLIDSLVKDVDLANFYVHEAEQKGMDVSDAKFDYGDIKKVLITTRTVLHYCDLDKYSETINEGFKITTNAKITGEEAIREYYFRRAGLGVSTLFITIIALTLYLKLRKIEKKDREEGKI